MVHVTVAQLRSDLADHFDDDHLELTANQLFVVNEEGERWLLAVIPLDSQQEVA